MPESRDFVRSLARSLLTTLNVLVIGECTGRYIVSANVKKIMGVKITLLEPHLEGAQFGPRSINEEDQAAVEEDDNDHSSPKSRSNLRRVIGLIAVSSMLLAAYRVIRSRTVGNSEEVGWSDRPRIKQVLEIASE